MKRPEPVEIALIAAPLLCEMVAVLLFIAACGLWLGIWSGHL